MLTPSCNVPFGAADVFLDCYVVIPRCCRYFTGLIAPNDSLIRFSLYQRMYLSEEADKFFQRDTRPVSAIEHFVFDTPEEAFTRSIIRRASFARHGPYKSGGVDTLEPARPPVMATTIAVYHRFIMFVERIECVIEHRIHQRRVRACSYRPAYNPGHQSSR